MTADSSKKANEKIKILHIGNIANNGYIASTILNTDDIESHLLVMDYYHTHGCPEWESAEVEGDWINDFYPAWHNVNLHGFKRPEWYSQGPRFLAMQYLAALNQKKTLKRLFIKTLMYVFRRAMSTPRLAARFHGYWYSRTANRIRARFKIDHPGSPPRPGKGPFPGAEYVTMPKASERMASLIAPANMKPGFINPQEKQDRERTLVHLRKVLEAAPADSQVAIDTRIKIDELEKRDRKPLPITAEVAHVEFDAHMWRGLFEFYDLVVGYSTEGHYAMMADKPYFALEHGTIRKIPFETDYLGRQTKAVYQNALCSLITNCDNYIAAERMGLKDFRFIPHPTMEAQVDEQRPRAEELRRRICKMRDCDFIVFAPARHHWDPELRDTNWDKGNDLLIRAFARLVHENGVKGLLICVDSGQTVDKSKALIAELKIANNVMWMKAQPHRSFIRYLLASDVIADNFGAPLTFGGIPPKAMMCRKPVLVSYTEQHHEWSFSQHPPLVNGRTADEIYEALLNLRNDPALAKRLGDEGHAWYFKEYSNKVFFHTFMNAVVDHLPHLKTRLKPETLALLAQARPAPIKARPAPKSAGVSSR
jgi:glycosyltransferase involved in cell wall biosynthesis